MGLARSLHRPSCSLVPRTRSSHIFAANTVANFGFKSGTSIIRLSVSLRFRSSHQRSPRGFANFGIGTLGCAGFCVIAFDEMRGNDGAVRPAYAALDSWQGGDVKFDISFLFGGQIKGERPRLFMVYSAGNFIECTIDTPYLQIGEHKYGKPVLDRAITHDTDLYDALKIGLISVDSTMRSNLSVGMPIDLLVVRSDTCAAELIYRIEPGEPYFQDLRQRWSAALRAAHLDIQRPPYRNPT